MAAKAVDVFKKVNVYQLSFLVADYSFQVVIAWFARLCVLCENKNNKIEDLIYSLRSKLFEGV